MHISTPKYCCGAHIIRSSSDRSVDVGDKKLLSKGYELIVLLAIVSSDCGGFGPRLSFVHGVMVD